MVPISDAETMASVSVTKAFALHLEHADSDVVINYYYIINSFHDGRVFRSRRLVKASIPRLHVGRVADLKKNNFFLLSHKK